MPKYVCEFEEVTKAGKDMCKTASDLVSSVKTYTSNLENELSQWTGEAKESFTKAETERLQTIGNTAAYLDNYGQFVQFASKAIEEADEQLSSLDA